MTYLCPFCFENSILRLRITELRRNRKLPNCTFHATRKGVPIGEVVRLVDPVLRSNYTIATEAFGIIPGSSFHDLLYEVTQAESDGIITALANALSDSEEIDEREGDFPFYGDDQNYEQIEPDGWLQSQLWSEFRHSIIHGNRFFNDNARELLREIFDKVHLQSDEAKQPAFYAIDASTSLFRARRVNSMSEAEKLAVNPAQEIGPPPQHLRAAGRMNAAGIGAFYGALDVDTCVAELRPPVGSFVCLSTFRPARSIYVLDFTRFERPGRHIDIFQKNYASRTTQWAFMQSFQHEISKPILKEDEHLEYVPAQVVAEYLTRTPVMVGTEERRIEGLVFRSAQHADGRNLVLFGDAGLVVGGHAPGGAPSSGDFDFGNVPSLPAAAAPAPALEFVASSFKVCSITSAHFLREAEYLAPAEPPDF